MREKSVGKGVRLRRERAAACRALLMNCEERNNCISRSGIQAAPPAAAAVLLHYSVLNVQKNNARPTYRLIHVRENKLNARTHPCAFSKVPTILYSLKRFFRRYSTRCLQCSNETAHSIPRWASLLPPTAWLYRAISSGKREQWTLLEARHTTYSHRNPFRDNIIQRDRKLICFKVFCIPSKIVVSVDF